MSTVIFIINIEKLEGIWFDSYTPDIKSKVSLSVENKDVKKDIIRIISKMDDIIDPDFYLFMRKNHRTCQIKINWDILVNFHSTERKTYNDICYLTFGVEKSGVRKVVGIGRNYYNTYALGQYFLLHGEFNNSTKELRLSKIFYKYEYKISKSPVSEITTEVFGKRKRRKRKNFNIDDTKSKSYT